MPANLKSSDFDLLGGFSSSVVFVGLADLVVVLVLIVVGVVAGVVVAVEVGTVAF